MKIIPLKSEAFPFPRRLISDRSNTGGVIQTMTDDKFAQALLELTECMYRVCYSQLYQAADREDAVQEALKRAWEKRHTLRDEGALKGWLIRILLNECHNIQRKSRLSVPMEHLPLPPPPDADGTLHDLILSLPEKYRTPVVLMFMEGMTAAETAKAMRIPQGTVHSRVHRARQLLREKWEEAQQE